MSSFLNSCLKVPIDPCNNCPAPVFNRPKIYLGCLSATPDTSNSTEKVRNCSELETDPKCTCGVIRSLANLYDSIPDYTDINHLSEEEFYSTLNTLRSTCRELKLERDCVSSVDPCRTTATLPSTSTRLGGSGNKPAKKNNKKVHNQSYKNNLESRISKSQQSEYTPSSRTSEKQKNYNKFTESKTPKKAFSNSFKKDLDKEIKLAKKSLKEFEEDFKRPLTSSNSNEKVPVPHTPTSTLHERLRKSSSYNDILSIPPPTELVESRKKNKTAELLSFKGGNGAVNDSTKLSNYFQENSPSNDSKLQEIIAHSTSAEEVYSNRLQAKKKARSKRDKEYKTPFECFNLDTSKKEAAVKQFRPSPLHPVARPNLAATLRAESSKKKMKEIKNSDTCNENTRLFDWELRKTPAWKTLSLNETHKEILRLRLATRKAEQALQRREYDLNMELMRQRVKSTPLLLEGPTYLGSHVTKIAHACQEEARRHKSQSNNSRAKRRKNVSRSHSCRRTMLFNTSSGLVEQNCDHLKNMLKVQAEISPRVFHKADALRKIYDGGSNCSNSDSHNSNHSTNTQQSSKHQKQRKVNKNHKNKETPSKNQTNLDAIGIDSCEELSSLDRKFL